MRSGKPHAYTQRASNISDVFIKNNHNLKNKLDKATPLLPFQAFQFHPPNMGKLSSCCLKRIHTIKANAVSSQNTFPEYKYIYCIYIHWSLSCLRRFSPPYFFSRFSLFHRFFPFSHQQVTSSLPKPNPCCIPVQSCIA